MLGIFLGEGAEQGGGFVELAFLAELLGEKEVGIAGGVRGRIFGDDFAVVIRRFRAGEKLLRALQGFGAGPLGDGIGRHGHEEESGEKEDLRPVLNPEGQRIESGVNRRRGGLGGAGHRARKVAKARRQRKSAFKQARYRLHAEAGAGRRGEDAARK